MQTLDQLLERVNAGEDSPDLNVELTIAFGRVPPDYERAVEHDKPQPYFWNQKNWKLPFFLPLRPFASLDDAFSLIPANWAIAHMASWPAAPEEAENIDRRPYASVDLVRPTISTMGSRRIWGFGGNDGHVEVKSDNLHRAITAAAIMAMIFNQEKPA